MEMILFAYRSQKIEVYCLRVCDAYMYRENRILFPAASCAISNNKNIEYTYAARRHTSFHSRFVVARLCEFSLTIRLFLQEFGKFRLQHAFGLSRSHIWSNSLLASPKNYDFLDFYPSLSLKLFAFLYVNTSSHALSDPCD